MLEGDVFEDEGDNHVEGPEEEELYPESSQWEGEKVAAKPTQTGTMTERVSGDSNYTRCINECNFI